MTPPTDRPAAIALWITAVLIAFFAVGLVVSPGELQTGHGVAAAPLGAYATEFRATSGGFKLGTAIALGLMTWSRRYGEGVDPGRRGLGLQRIGSGDRMCPRRRHHAARGGSPPRSCLAPFRVAGTCGACGGYRWGPTDKQRLLIAPGKRKRAFCLPSITATQTPRPPSWILPKIRSHHGSLARSTTSVLVSAFRSGRFAILN